MHVWLIQIVDSNFHFTQRKTNFQVEICSKDGRRGYVALSIKWNWNIYTYWTEWSVADITNVALS